MSNPQIEDGYTKIANELMDALCKIRVPGEAYQVLNFIFRKTYGWNKKSDIISLSQFQNGTGIFDKKSIIRAIQKLKEINIIIVGEKANEFGKIYCINKKYSTWKPLAKKPTLAKKPMTVGEKANESLAKKPPTKDNIQKTLSKDILYTGDKPQKAKSEHVLFLENWSDLYSSVSGHPYKIDWKKDSSLVTGLIKSFGYETVLKKAKLLFSACQNKSLWFTKDGIADFTIGKLSSQWNGIIEKSLPGDDWVKQKEEELKNVRTK